MYSYPQLASPYAFMLVRKRGADARIVKEDQDPDGIIYFNKYQCNYIDIREYKKNSNYGIKRFRTILNGFAAPGRYNKITHITIGESGIRDIRGISKLSALESLSMHSQKIVNIPEEIKLLSDIVIIILEENHIKCVDILGECKKLRYLELSVNRISVFPQSFVNLKNLRELKLSYNNIECIPNIAMNVEILDISHNNLKDISVLSSWKNLRYLYVSHNKISQIPSIKNILHIDACHNELSGDITFSVPKNRNTKTAIDYINLTYNKITSFTCKLEVFDLYLDNNELNSIPRLIYDSNNLGVLSLNNNNISIKLSYLNLPNGYERISIYNNSIKGQITVYSCQANLQILDLSHNLISTYSVLACYCRRQAHNHKLSELYLNNNVLKRYSGPDYELLSVLDLKNNRLERVDTSVSNSYIRQLDISNNNILLKNYVVPGLVNMVLIANGNRIENIHISDNRIMTAIIDKETNIQSNSDRLTITRI